jgi:glyoxylase-like metal-dependent hydrolase (beta-lactamase superfamily II)
LPAAMSNVEQLAPDLWRINLPLPFRLRSINVYLVRGDDGFALIDAGIDTPESREAFDDALASIGLTSAEIKDVFVTHMHPDHIGLSGRRAASGSTVHLMRGEERRARYVWSSLPLDAWVSFLRLHGLADDAAMGVTDAATHLRPSVSLPDSFAYVNDGDEVRLGDRTVRIVWTPGHSDFHYVLIDDRARAIFGGDHLLPAITPNIGLYPECRPNPLDDYLRSFDRFERVGDYVVYPAHGEPYAALPERIRQLRLHHRERLRGVWDCTSAADSIGASSADIVTHFWGERLNAHETRFALVEVAAHLEYLRLTGDLAAEAVGGVQRYRCIRRAPTLTGL